MFNVLHLVLYLVLVCVLVCVCVYVLVFVVHFQLGGGGYEGEGAHAIHS